MRSVRLFAGSPFCSATVSLTACEAPHASFAALFRGFKILSAASLKGVVFERGVMFKRDIYR